MGLVIEDGTGSGKQAKVNGDNRLYVNSTIKTSDAQVNLTSGKVWSCTLDDVATSGADDYIFYLKNTGDNAIHITDIRLKAETAATQIEVHAVTGTATNGTAITPASRTVGSGATMSATVESGTNITNITKSGETLFFLQLNTVGQEYHLSTSSKIRLPKGQAVALLVETSTASITGVISIAEETTID